VTITVPYSLRRSLSTASTPASTSTQRSRHKDAYYLAVLSARPSRYTGTFPVAMHYHFRLRGSRLDVSNHAYMQKMCEDALVAAERPAGR
jgi:hypothetical protein